MDLWCSFARYLPNFFNSRSLAWKISLLAHPFREAQAQFHQLSPLHASISFTNRRIGWLECFASMYHFLSTRRIKCCFMIPLWNPHALLKIKCFMWLCCKKGSIQGTGWKRSLERTLEDVLCVANHQRWWITYSLPIPMPFSHLHGRKFASL